MCCRRPLLFAVFCTALLSLPGLAFAQHGDFSDSVRFQDDLNPNEFMVTARMRAVAIPSFVFGIFYDEHASHWSEGQRNLSYGGELVWRRGNDFELGIALDRADLSMASAFWKESGDAPQSAEWTEIDLQVWSTVFSGYWFWDVKDWFTPYLGGGIGLGIVIDNVDRYEPQQGSPCYRNLGGQDAAFAPPECFQDDGQPSEDAIDFTNPTTETDIPSVVPMIHLSTGVRFNIKNYGVLKMEAGIYPYVFAGIGLGAQW